MTAARPLPDQGVLPTLRRLAQYLFVRPIVVSAAAVLLLAALVVQSIQPLLFGRAVNDVANGNTETLDQQAFVIVALAMVTWVFRWTAANLVAIAAQTAMKRLAKNSSRRCRRSRSDSTRAGRLAS